MTSELTNPKTWRWDKDLAQVNMRILQSAEQPLSTQAINEQAADILGDQWTDTTRIHLSHIRTALKHHGLLVNNPRGYWTTAPDIYTPLARLFNLTDAMIYSAYELSKKPPLQDTDDR